MPDSEYSNSQHRNSSLSEELEILRTAPTKDYQDILFLCRIICEAPAAVLLILDEDKFWIKAAHGLAQEKADFDFPRLKKIINAKKLVILDEQEKLEHNLNFSGYVALPLLTQEEHQIGILLSMGEKNTSLNSDKKNAFKILGEQILNLVEYRRQNNKILRVQHQQEQKYAELEKFASVVSHDLKSPLANIISLTELLKEESLDSMNAEARQYIDFLSQASHSLRSYIDGILVFYRSEKILEKEEEDVDLQKFFERIIKLYAVKHDVEINYPRRGVLKKVNKAALTQIFMNLISNALKYNNKPHRKVDISFQATPTHYFFEVKDNGNGIQKEHFSRIFNLFTTLDENDRDGNPGSGIGLATVKKLLDHMNAEIDIESQPGKGSNFMFKIRR